MFGCHFDALKKQWNGVKTESGPKASLGIELVKSLLRHGSKISQICANTETARTFDELYTLTMRAAIKLRHFGCKNGDVIFFMTANTADIASIIFAALYLGVQVSAFPVFSSRTEYECFLSLTQPKIVICDLEKYQITKRCLLNQNIQATILTFGGQTDVAIPVTVLFEKQEANVKIEPAADIDPFTHTAYILQTSGTTGKRKGVRISHALILDKMRRLSGVLGEDDIVLGFTFLDGVSGIRSLIGSTLNGSARIVNHDPFSPKRYCEIVDKFKVTVSIVSAAKVTGLLDYKEIRFADLSSVKWFLSGGTKITQPVIQKISKYLTGGKFCQTYGMTETASTIAVNLKHTNNDSVGQLISGCKAKIVNDAGERLGIGEIGELCVKFPCSILGYLVNDLNYKGHLDDEEFFMTGDVAYFDENNDLFIVDRKKAMFKCFGYPVSPVEIEDYLNTIEGVRQSCVFPIPDLHFNSVPASLIVKTKTSKCTEQSIYNAISRQFSYYKHLRGGVYFVDKLPINARGKINRSLANQMAAEFLTDRRQSV